MNEVIVEVNKFEDISYNLYSIQGKKNLPLIIVGHGFNNDKLECSKLALRLAWQGFAVLCFDLYNQGDRYNGFLEEIKSDSEFGFALFNIIEKSSDDIEKLITIVDEDDRIDSERIGLVGYSLSANLCFYKFKTNKRIKTIVPILGAPNFEKLIVDAMEKESIEDFTSNEEKELLDYINKLNPYEYLLNSETRPMLIINAKKDDSIPYEFSEEFYNNVKKRYEKISKDIEFIIEDEYHHISDDMLNRTVEWLKKYV